MDQIGSWATPTNTNAAHGVQLPGLTIIEPIYEVARIHFPTGLALLDDRDKSRLAMLAAAYEVVLKTSPLPIKFYIVGYTDERGSERLNLDLSQKRAATVADYFKGLLLPRLGPSHVPVSFAVHGQGKAEEPPDSPLVHSGILTRGEFPALGNRWHALARWRRVSIFASVSGAPVKAGIELLRQSLRKAAGQAYRGHKHQIEKLHKLVDTYKRRLGEGPNSVTAYNTTFLTWYETRLKDREKSFEELQKAIQLGDKAFLEWFSKKRRPYREFALEVTARLREEVQRYEAEKATATPEEKALIESIINGLQSDITTLEDELQYI